MKQLAVFAALLLAAMFTGCGSRNHAVDLSGCYSSTLYASQPDGPPSVVPGHTFCAGPNVYDSYQGVPDSDGVRIEEVREVDFDEHHTTRQHFVGRATATEADITDFVDVFTDGVLKDSWMQVFQYRDVVRVPTGSQGSAAEVAAE